MKKLIGLVAGFCAIYGLNNHQAIAADSDCPANYDNKGQQLTGSLPIGDAEEFTYLSRMEELSSGKLRFIYCITNNRLYRPVNIRWVGLNGEVYYEGSVPPEGKTRHNSYETEVKGYISSQRELAYGPGENEKVSRDTIVSKLEGKSKPDKSKTLKSSAIIDIPRDPKTKLLLERGEYEKYSPLDFLTIAVDFTSTFEQSEGGKGTISNSLALKFVGDTASLESNLGQWPKFVGAYNWTDKTLLLGKYSETMLPIQVDLKGTVPVNTTEVTIPDAATERYAAITIGDVDAIYAQIPVSYFSPE